jgi:asparagine synthase (glutamine-hydrolysing)
MTNAIAHRGPDGEGFFGAPGIGLGHRRLAIIDLEGGYQPMASRDGAIQVTYNGEIYNHLDLRRRLQERGHVFTTRCDTEVLIHGYLEWGVDLPRQLNGMFAFGLWDARERLLFLARDRFGEKPLFYAQRADGSLLFASEAKALVAHPDFHAAVAEPGLAAYLTFEYLPGDLSLFHGVRKLLPAHYLTWRDGRVERWSGGSWPTCRWGSSSRAASIRAPSRRRSSHSGIPGR